MAVADALLPLCERKAKSVIRKLALRSGYCNVAT